MSDPEPNAGRIPRKRPELVVNGDHPLNAEPHLPLLQESFVTPSDAFCVRCHGDVPEVDPGPYRLAVVGSYGSARSVKWLSEITLQTRSSHNYYQTVEYKLFPPRVTAENADYSRGGMLSELPVNCAILAPESGETVGRGSVPVRGYAVAGGDRKIVRVEVSADGGVSWTEAALTQEDAPGTWRFWEATLELPPGPREILARAFDSAGGAQPASVGETWNFLGYVNNA